LALEPAVAQEIASGMRDWAAHPAAKHALTIPGRRIDLVALGERHLPLLVAWRNDPDITRAFFSRPAFTLAAQTEWFARFAQDPTDFYFVIAAKKGPDIGTASISKIDWQARTGEFGRFLIGDPRFRGTGYGRESAELLIRFAQSELGLRSLSLSVRSGNASALRLYKALGFVETTTTGRRSPDGRMEIAQTMTLDLGKSHTPEARRR
jgi:RimJ/RimL family protein N-acetyltransferase